MKQESKMKKLSIIIPVYNNELNLRPLYEKLSKEVLNKNNIKYEIIFVDDGSEDNSYSKLLKLREKDKNIKIIKFTRNFGAYTAIFAGLKYANGNCMLIIPADLQTPPKLILEMYSWWEKDYKIVLAVRDDREEGKIQSFFSNTYWKLAKKYALKNTPEKGYDSFLIDRKIADSISNANEKNSPLSAQILWYGYKVKKIYYVRKKRELGKSQWTLSKKIKLFIDTFIAFSYAPIKIISGLGIIISLAAFIFAMIILFNKFYNNIPIQGWASLMIVLLGLSGIQLITLAIIGEYLWRNFDESRKRPIYIVEKEIGIDDKK